MTTDQKAPNEKLRRERELRGWSQKRMADLIDTSKEMVSRWECGERSPGKKYQERLCQLFSKTAEDLGFMETPSEIEISRITDPGKMLLQKASRPRDTISMQAVNQQAETSTFFSPSMTQDIMDAVGNLGKENNEDMDPVRRATVAGLLSLMGGAPVSLEWWERLTYTHPSAMNADAFKYVQQLLEIGWGLSNAGELHLAEQILISFLPRILQLTPYREEAAVLAAEGLRLRGILAAHQQRLSDKLAICLQAVEYARQANNLDILIAQLTELAVAFKYARQPANSFKIYQEALSYCEQGHLSPLVRSRIYAASAPTLAKNGYIKEAHSYVEKAYNSFPKKLDSEPTAFSADNKIFMIDYYQGLLYLVVNQPEESYKTFERAMAQPSGNELPERWRLIILNYQGLAAILSKQLDQYARCLEEGVSGSIALRSQKRFDEAVSIFQQHLPKTWHAESRIKQISERFQLERKSIREEELEI